MSDPFDDTIQWVPAQPGETPGQMEPEVFLTTIPGTQLEISGERMEFEEAVRSKLNEILNMMDRLEPLITFAEQQIAKHHKLMGLIRR